MDDEQNATLLRGTAGRANLLARWLESIDEWTRGRHWPMRAVLVVAFVVFGVALSCDPSRGTIFGPIDLGIHEGGHVVFRSGGEVMHALGGTLLQCLAPIAAALVLARLPDWFGVAFCGMWLGVNLLEVAHYMADARAMALPLVSLGGGDVQHDWNYLFGRFGCLRSDTVIAGAVRGIAFLILWGSIAASGALVARILCNARSARGGLDVPLSAERRSATGSGSSRRP